MCQIFRLLRSLSCDSVGGLTVGNCTGRIEQYWLLVKGSPYIVERGRKGTGVKILSVVFYITLSHDVIIILVEISTDIPKTVGIQLCEIYGP